MLAQRATTVKDKVSDVVKLRTATSSRMRPIACKHCIVCLQYLQGNQQAHQVGTCMRAQSDRRHGSPNKDCVVRIEPVNHTKHAEQEGPQQRKTQADLSYGLGTSETQGIRTWSLAGVYLKATMCPDICQEPHFLKQTIAIAFCQPQISASRADK